MDRSSDKLCAGVPTSGGGEATEGGQDTTEDGTAAGTYTTSKTKSNLL